MNIAQNYAKILPDNYYIEIEDNKNIKVYTPNGTEIYTNSHSLEKLIEKKDGEVVYQVTSKSSVDLMIEEYGKTQIQKIIGVPPKVMTAHKQVQTIEKIVEIPKEVVIEKCVC